MPEILVPVDLSAYSRIAADYAVDVAKHLKSHVTFFHAYHPFAHVPELRALATPGELELLYVDSLRSLKQWCAAYAQEHPEGFSCVVGEGWPSDEILYMASKIDPLMIIMGRKGLSRVERTVMGSVSMQVVRKSHYPVLVVSEGARKRTLRHVVMATDYRHGDAARTDFVARFAESYGADLVVVHAIGKDEHNLLDHDLIAAYAESFHRRHDKVRFELIRDVNTERALSSYLDTANADLLVVTRAKDKFFNRILFPGFTKKAMRHASVPLLIFPDAGRVMNYPEIRISSTQKAAAR